MNKAPGEIYPISQSTVKVYMGYLLQILWASPRINQALSTLPVCINMQSSPIHHVVNIRTENYHKLSDYRNFVSKVIRLHIRHNRKFCNTNIFKIEKLPVDKQQEDVLWISYEREKN